ncbi:MAG: hypothetical protein Q4D99_08130 [Bacillota bacterium]|nr:hypothetical protein [Bacillota bacterium]
MFKKKNATSGQATKRVKDLLEMHVHLLTKPNRTFSNLRNEGFFLDQPINPKNPDDYAKLGYILQKKFISRSFNLELQTTINNVDIPENFLLKLKFAGFPKIEVTYFKGDKQSAKYEKYFNDPKLLARLEKVAKTVDVEFIIVEYNRSLNAFKIRVAPIPGSVLWIVFPPLYFKMPLKKEEITALWDALIMLRKYTMKLIEANNWQGEYSDESEL